MPKLASILVGDHLGQVKKVLWPSGEITALPDLAEPSNSNPVVSIEPIDPTTYNKHLIATRDGSLYIYDSIRGIMKKCDISGSEGIIKALPLDNKNVTFIYDKQIVFESKNHTLKQKKGQIRNASIHNNQLAIVGKDIPLKIFDTKRKEKIFEADLPSKNWLKIQPDCEVVGLDFVAKTRVVTCSKSDSVIRVYDTLGQSKPVITIDMNQTAFNEYAEAGRFMSVASTGDVGHSVVVGSNVGQLIAIDLRFNTKQQPKKRLQPKSYKVLGGFKGARGATLKDIKIIKEDESEPANNHKVISLCLDRYMRIHNFSKGIRSLDKHIYMKTKPLCCSPVFYRDP